MIKAIVFDCFGVFYIDQFAGFIERSSEQIQPELRRIMLEIDLGKISNEEVVKQYAKLTGIAESEIERQLFTVMRVRNQKLLNYSQELRKKYKIGLLSNASPGSIDKYFTPHERTKYFDAFVVSSEVDLIKPWPEMFMFISDKLGVLPNEVVFIDDNPLNCDGARKVGMQAILYESFNDLRLRLDKLLS